MHGSLLRLSGVCYSPNQQPHKYVSQIAWRAPLAIVATVVSDSRFVCAGLSSLPTALAVTVGVRINGQLIAGNTSCTAGVFNSACLPQLKADDPNEKVVISYQVLPNATLPSTAHVSLRVCYSAPSARDRLWRKANDIIVVRQDPAQRAWLTIACTDCNLAGLASTLLYITGPAVQLLSIK